MIHIPSEAPVRVGLVEDHHLVRDGLRLVLGMRDDIEVVAEASDGPGAFEIVDRDRPDVLVLDISLGDTDAIPLIPSLLARSPRLKVVVLTMHRDGETVRQALLAGAAGYVVKGAHSSELTDAILAVARGQRYLHSSVTATVIDDSMRWLQRGDPLSAREREVLSLLASGQSAVEISGALGISAHTVRRHVANLALKLGLHGRAALVRYALEHGIVRGSGRREHNTPGAAGERRP